MELGKVGSSTESVATVTSEEFVLVQGSPQGSGGKPRLKVRPHHLGATETSLRLKSAFIIVGKGSAGLSLVPSALVHIFAVYLPQMSWNGSEQLEKAMEEVLDDDDDDELKVEKSNVEKMEKHSTPETSVPEPPATGISFRMI